MIFLTAQRVVSLRGQTGVNVFRRTASEPPAEDAVVEAEYIEVPPGGNTVHSYLDVEAPQGMSAEEVARVIDEVAGTGARLELPLRLERDGLSILFGCAVEIEARWRDELRDLARYLARPTAG